MNFDRLAPHYRWLEIVLAGEKLQRCRTAFLADATTARRVLVLGEGNGRFLTELLRVNQRAQVTCLDASKGMLALARQCIERHGFSAARVDFVHADVLDWPAPGSQFDLIVTHFFLDCFRADQLESVVAKLTGTVTPPARWLLSDFCEPERPGLARWRAQVILKSMYLFFRFATALPARQVTPPDEPLNRHGFRLLERRHREWGLLHTDLWEHTGSGSR